jgi:hypothetical protein
VTADRFGEADEVVQDSPQGRAVRVALQQVSTETSQAPDHIELGERGQVTGVDPCVCPFCPVSCLGGDSAVKGIESPVK